MVTTRTHICDCINWCGDDPALKSDSSIACDDYRKRQADAAAAVKRAEERIALCKAWGVTDTDELVITMQANVTRLQGEMGVLHQLLRKASDVINTIEPECNTEALQLALLQLQITSALEPANTPTLFDPEPGELCPRCAALEFNRVSGFGELAP